MVRHADVAQAEADLAAALYIELMAFRSACERRGAKLGACEVGIVTPYKQQKLCLRETFLRAAGPDASSKVLPRPFISHMILHACHMHRDFPACRLPRSQQ